MPTNVTVFSRNIELGTKKFLAVFPVMVERRVRPLIEKELKNVPVRTGTLLKSRYIKVRKYPGRVIFTFGYRAFYANFTGAGERLRNFKQSKAVRRALALALRDSFRPAFGRDVKFTISTR